MHRIFFQLADSKLLQEADIDFDETADGYNSEFRQSDALGSLLVRQNLTLVPANESLLSEKRLKKGNQ